MLTQLSSTVEEEKVGNQQEDQVGLTPVEEELTE
jgi:hypothetical protein